MATAVQWRLRALQPASAGPVAWTNVRLLGAAGPVDGGAALGSLVAPAGGVLADLLTDGNTSPVSFAHDDVASPGFRLEWSLAAAETVTGARIEGDGVLAMRVEYLDGSGLWVTAGQRFSDEPMSGDIDFESTQAPADYPVNATSDLVWNSAVGSTSSAPLTALAGGGVQVGASSQQKVFNLAASPTYPWKGSWFELEFKVVSDGLTHCGFFLYDPAQPSDGYRFAFIWGNQLFQSYYSGPTGAETSLGPGLTGFPSIGDGNRHVYRLAVDQQGNVVHSLDGTAINTPMAISAVFPQVRLGFFAYTGVYDVYGFRAANTSEFTDERSVKAFMPEVARVRGAEQTAGWPHLPVPPVVPDLVDTGRFRIYGDVEAKGVPVNQPLYRRVRLMHQRSGRMVREAWSDPVTGAFSFDHIKGGEQYYVETFDHEGNFQGVLADRLTPEAMA